MAVTRRVLLKIFFREHVSAITFSSTATLMALGLIAEGSGSPAAVVVSFMLSCVLVIYYAGYLLNYRQLLRHARRAEYLQNLYSLWSVVVFAILSIFAFALIGSLLDRFRPGYFFFGAGMNEILLLLIGLVLDAMCFGVLSGLDVPLDNLSGKGFGGVVFVFLSSSLIKGALGGAVFATLRDIFKAERDASEVFDSPPVVREVENCPSHRTVNALYARYVREEQLNEEQERMILARIGQARHPRARALALLIAQRTGSLEIFTSAVDYLVKVKDYRVARMNRSGMSVDFLAALESALARRPRARSRAGRRRSR